MSIFNATPDEQCKFLVALAATMRATSATLDDLIEDITKAHWRLLADQMLVAGIHKDDLDRVYEECSGHMFGVWS